MSTAWLPARHKHSPPFAFPRYFPPSQLPFPCLSFPVALFSSWQIYTVFSWHTPGIVSRSGKYFILLAKGKIYVIDLMIVNVMKRIGIRIQNWPNSLTLVCSQYVTDFENTTSGLISLLYIQLCYRMCRTINHYWKWDCVFHEYVGNIDSVVWHKPLFGSVHKDTTSPPGAGGSVPSHFTNPSLQTASSALTRKSN